MQAKWYLRAGEGENIGARYTIFLCYSFIEGVCIGSGACQEVIATAC